jgi:hypothetical protein
MPISSVIPVKSDSYHDFTGNLEKCIFKKDILYSSAFFTLGRVDPTYPNLTAPALQLSSRVKRGDLEGLGQPNEIATSLHSSQRRLHGPLPCRCNNLDP